MADIEGFETIAELLAATIENKGLSQTEAAAKLGISQPALHHWLRGTSQPKPENLRIISKFTGYSVDRLDEMRRQMRRGIVSSQRVEDLETELRALRRTVDRLADDLDAVRRRLP